jgi:hypothetical protein
LTQLSELVDETPRDRTIALLQMLDGLIERALQAERYETVLRLMGEARWHFAWLDEQRERSSRRVR